MQFPFFFFFFKQTGYIYLQKSIHLLEDIHTWLHDGFCFLVKILSPKNFNKIFIKGILHYNANEMFTISADIVFKPQMLLMTPY